MHPCIVSGTAYCPCARCSACVFCVCALVLSCSLLACKGVDGSAFVLGPHVVVGVSWAACVARILVTLLCVSGYAGGGDGR